MRRLFAFFITALVVGQAMADPIDAVRAKQIAEAFQLPGHDLTLVKRATRNAAKARKLSARVAATSPYYIYSRGEGQGFVIVAGDDCMPQILGYTDAGDFDEATVPPALQDMLTVWTQQVEDAQIAGTNQPVMEAKRRAASSGRTSIAPLMTSHWHQNSPYNDQCPFLTGTTNRAVTGCVATAASQILYYWRKDLPSTLQATTPTYGYGDAPVTESVPKGTEMRWDLMRDSYSGGESTASRAAVAEFVFATGAATWLTYGSSTSGNIEKIPNTFSGYFGMRGGAVYYRDSYTQEYWVQLLYKELQAGRPVMYTGVHSESGGHAVVVHGYQATNDLFYFNFGWGAGNGYDGYYTVDTETGMNGFNGYQSALIGAYPRKWNMTAKINAPNKVYAQRTNTFEVVVENASTLPQSGFYLFAATNKNNPSSLTSAKSSETETVIAQGKSATFELTCKPTNTKPWYITVTDADLNVLNQIEVVPEVASAELAMHSIVANGSADVEEIDGISYAKFYNNRAMVTVNVANEGAIDYEGTAKINILVYDEVLGEWVLNGTKSLSNTVIPAHENRDLVFNVSNVSTCPIAAGKRYCAEINSPWKSLVASDSIDTSKAISQKAYFVVTGESDFAINTFEDGILSFTGHWDRYAFETFVKRAAYNSAIAYDLTQVEALSDDIDNTMLPSQNALIYVAGQQIFQSPNVVNENGVCGNLQLDADYDFQPKAAFSAQQGSLTIGSEIARWYLLTTPFEASVPDGIIARRIDSHKSTGITVSSVTDVDTLEVGHTYLVMSSAYRNRQLTAINEGTSVSVLAAPLENADTAVVGIFTSTTIPVGAQLLNDDELQKFVPITEATVVEGLRGYFYDSKLKKQFRAYPSLSLDPAYVTLAKTIQQAYDLLDEYRDSVTINSYNAYADSIHAAEYEFSHRATTTLTTAKLITNYAAHLIELAEDYKAGRLDEQQRYDINADGAFDLADVVDLISMYLAATAESPATVDLDGDGMLTTADITLLIQAYMKK